MVNDEWSMIGKLLTVNHSICGFFCFIFSDILWKIRCFWRSCCVGFLLFWEWACFLLLLGMMLLPRISWKARLWFIWVRFWVWRCESLLSCYTMSGNGHLRWLLRCLVEQILLRPLFPFGFPLGQWQWQKNYQWM